MLPAWAASLDKHKSTLSEFSVGQGEEAATVYPALAGGPFLPALLSVVISMVNAMKMQDLFLRKRKEWAFRYAKIKLTLFIFLGIYKKALLPKEFQIV